jgi:undecaprenyl-diphosphatase
MDGTDVIMWFQGMHGSILDPIMVCLSYSMTLGATWIVLVAVLALRGRKREAVFILVALAISVFMSSFLLKTVFDTARPFEVMPLDVLIPLPTDSSFPSGHACNAFAGAVAILLMDRRLGAAAIAYASLVCISRIYVGVHWPADVIGGIAIGTAIAVTVYILMCRHYGYRIGTRAPPETGGDPGRAYGSLLQKG